MNILLDFISLSTFTGAGEYVRRIYFSLLESINDSKRHDISLYALIDSSKGICYSDIGEEFFRENHIRSLDTRSQGGILNVIANNKIDKFFIGCAQYIGRYLDVDKISCQVICVVHDLSYEENFYNNIQPFQALNHHLFHQDVIQKPMGLRMLLHWKSPTMRYCRWYFSMRSKAMWEKDLIWMERIVSLLNNNPSNILIAVSEYTKNTIVYNFNISPEKIVVFYSPERVFDEHRGVCDIMLKRIVERKIKYYLIVSAGRIEKNAYKALSAFQRFNQDRPDTIIVTIGYGRKLFDNHIDLPFLSDSDLAICYQNCFALIYPSFFEGFGYPPLEAMRYSKPILSSNVCSMPEMLGPAAIYFSPMYCSDIYKALCTLTEENYEYYSIQSSRRFSEIHKKQVDDLSLLINTLIQ